MSPSSDLRAEMNFPCRSQPRLARSPAAPLVAARMENRTVEIAPLRDWFTQVRGNRKSILVEGAGGWLVPINETQSVADLAVALDLSVVVVVANRLGCLEPHAPHGRKHPLRVAWSARV